ncbi:MAG: DUF503 domain-containing protein [Phycisphaerales bacterium]|nr:DUF503 domain-containing protein [Phycisphaerales bacterium]
MKIGILQVSLRIGDALNVREKHGVLKSLKDRWHKRHNISLAEVEYLEQPQHAMLGIAMVGNEKRFLESALAKLVEELKGERRLELLDFQIEIIG